VSHSVCNALLNKKPYDVEFRILRKDATVRFVHEKAEVIFDRAGRAVRMVGMIQDISDRKRMENQLRKLSQAIEQSPSSIIITDIEGNIEYVNPKFSALTGYALEEVMGRNPRFLKSGETPSEEYSHLWNTITSGEVWKGEFHNKKKDGELYWESVTISPVKSPEGVFTGFMAIKEDITEHKQIESRKSAQYAVTQVLAESATLDEASPKILKAICECLEWDIGEFWLIDKQRCVLRCTEIYHLPAVNTPEFHVVSREITFPHGIGLPGRVWTSRKPLWIADIIHDAGFLRASVAEKEGLHGACCFPIISKGEFLGAIDFISREIKQPDDDLLNMMSAIGRQIGLFIKHKQAEEQTRLQLERLSALHDIDRAIASTFDMKVSLPIFLEKVVAQLKVDAADVLLFNPHIQTLEGWAMALDLRDKETVGHSRRVTEITAQIALEMGIRKQEIVHVSRGALLHDIGKMGIPDSVLLKVEPLTDQEW
jgi:PAS domain S-box-containing protein